MERVLEDSVFHQRSGGGVTLSGGEPLFQGGFALELLREAARWGVASAVETSGAADPAVLEEAGAMAGSVIYDLKHWDPGRLAEAGIREGGGGAPPGPAGNLRRLRRRLPSLPIQVRIPVVPGFNDSLGDLLRIAALVPPGLPPPELLPYHRMGEGKYALLGRVPPFRAEPPDPASFGALRDSFLRALAR
jgi:pyruvate formate lyase activating enzyme